jgi:hypothetical protein
MILTQVIESLVGLNERRQAVDLLETFFKHSNSYEQFDELGSIAFKIKEYKLAAKYEKQALYNSTTNEMLWAARSNLINIYNHCNHPEDALALISVNETINPDDNDTRLSKAFSYYLLDRKKDAEQIIRNELKKNNLKDKTRTALLFNLGTYELYNDNLLYGLECFLIEGKKMGLWKAPKPIGEQWIGQPAEGRDLFIIAEAGIGDEIINVRFINHLKRKGINPIWYTERKDTYEIFMDSGFNATMNKDAYKPGMLWTMSMTIPLYLESTYDTLWEGIYLNAHNDFINKYDWISKLEGKKIGLRWQGNKEYEHDLHRSLPLKELINNIPSNNTYISLQRDQGIEELLPEYNIRDMSSSMTTFRDTLAIIHHLDLVITTCTSIAHAAAAMGKQTIVMVPISAYYTWCHSTEKSPWYGSNVTLIRQVKPRDWTEPINKLNNILSL